MKKSQIILLQILFAVIPALSSISLFAQSDTIRSFHIGLVYPISSNGLKAAEYSNRFSLHAIAGVSKNETVIAVSGAANITRQNADGAVISGLMNLIGNSANGTQIAGFANITRNEAAGSGVAGFMNLAGSGKGVQIAGFANVIKNDMKGLQVAGFLNKSRNTGSQVSGFMNVAKNVKGIQLAGLINFADSSDYPIALLNFVKNGEKSVSLTLDETLTGMATFRSGGKVLYGILGVGYNFKDDRRSVYAVESGLGAHIPVAGSFKINTEIVNQFLSDFKKGDYAKYNLRILPAYKFGNHFEIFGGPTINYIKHSKNKGYDYIDKFIWSKNGSRDFQGIYVGFNAGIQFVW
ncbi:hypothetical protein [Dyadobacter psychrotolerans]|uniref:Uncharacterized protein n=1 Tax=Dyadobacter psychrotolerans TaxID=2541721 RepID=A0A4R5DQK1_9BACT|nr:hypothetical protein [Dyadobacter psychrotolerans]TDE14524.1 hypothetical protein E0F88_15105 [Dyadobacter psychrotolerans]